MTDQPQLDRNMSVADLLRACPQVIGVFIRRRMNCVGCEMAAFESLCEAAQVYGIAPDDFLRELSEAITPREDIPGEPNPLETQE